MCDCTVRPHPRHIPLFPRSSVPHSFFHCSFSLPLCVSQQTSLCLCVRVCAHVCEKAIHLLPPDTFYNYNGLAFPPCQLMLSSFLCAAVCLCVGTYVWCAWVCVCAYHIPKHHHLSSLVITLYISCHLLWVETRDLGSELIHACAHTCTRTHKECCHISCVLNKVFALHV